MADAEKKDIDQSWLEEDDDGQLAIDVMESDDEIILVAPIAGVKKTDIDIAINSEMVTIKGTRRSPHISSDDHYFIQECYWGPFSRNYILPTPIDPNNVKANLKDGLLIVTIPKDAKSKAKSVKITEA